MAKQPTFLPARSKVRIFFVDADLAAGDMHELTAALTSAVRPTHQIVKSGSRTPAALTPPTEIDDNEPADNGEVLENGSEDLEVVGGQTESQKTPAKPRKYRSPKVVNELDMKAGGKAFEDFAAEKGNPSEHNSRFLVAAYWLAELGGVPAPSVDHIYTCYKSVGWTFDVADPGKPFRALKAAGWGETKGGKFTINHLGKSRVEKMTRSDGPQQ